MPTPNEPAFPGPILGPHEGDALSKILEGSAAQTATPETDIEEQKFSEDWLGPYGNSVRAVYSKFARSLETRLTAETKRADDAERERAKDFAAYRELERDHEAWLKLPLWLMGLPEFHDAERTGDMPNRIRLFIESLRTERDALQAKLEAWERIGPVSGLSPAEYVTAAQKQIERLREALTHVKGCFDAAFCEGLQALLNEGGPLVELLRRRLLYDLPAVVDTALAS